MTFVSFVLPMTSGPWAFCECIGEFEKSSNLLYRFIFRESFAKALAKDGLHLKARWPKLCGLAKASLQECCSLGVEVSELADEGEQGPKYYAKSIESECAALCSHHRKITAAHLSEVLFHTRLMYR